MYPVRDQSLSIEFGWLFQMNEQTQEQFKTL